MLRRLFLPLSALLALVLVPAVAVGKKDDKLPNVAPAHVSDVTSTGVTVRADVNTRGIAGSFAVEWGPTEAFGARTADMPLAADPGNQDATATLTGLAPATTYFFHVVATNDNGSDAGATATFTTAPAADAAPPAAPAPKGTDKDKDKGKSNGNANGNANGKPEDTPRGRSESIPAPNLLDGPVATPADVVVGKKVVVGSEEGTIKVRVPGTDDYTEVGPGAAVPVGSIVDARNGTVRLTTAVGDDTQDALLHGAKFEVRQARHSHGMTDILLRGGDFSACRRTDGAVASAASRKRRHRTTRRSLWAKDNSGRFRTHGRQSVATVRGTEWRTTDTCRGTTTSVREGAVLVQERHRHKRVLVRAGKSYFARAAGR
jgi:hypothetical protein